MNFFIIIANRFSKVLGSIIKGISYIIYAIYPKLRFTIPKYSSAKIQNKTSNIPKIIWQTNFTNKVTLPVYINYLYNRLMSLDYDYRYVSTEDREEYIKHYASDDEYEQFQKLTNGAAQADFWRVFVLNREGGVYMDIDAHLFWPLSKIIKNDDKELFILTKRGTYNNYFIASVPNNPILKSALEIIMNNIKNRNVDKGVYFLTGPEAFNQAIKDKKVNAKIYRYVAIQGSFTNEHFQYLDRPKSKWTYAKNEELLKK